MEHDLPRNLTDEHKKMVDDLFEWLIPPTFGNFQTHCSVLRCKVLSICSLILHAIIDHVLLQRFLQ